MSSTQSIRNTIKMFNMESQKKRGETTGQKKELRNGQNFSKWKDIQLQIQEAQYTPSKTNTKKISPRHIVIKLLKIKDKEKNSESNQRKKMFYI